MNKILIVEDEEAIANLIKMNLQHAGYHCEVANDGNTGADMMAENSYDLCLFDIMLPGINGYELLEYAKSLHMPVIFLTAKGETIDKVKGLKMGADDYITKPFEIIELLARVENVLRRFHKVEQGIQIGNLLLFMRNPDRALYREMIYEQVWDSPYMGDSRTVDLHVQRLRRKAGLEQQIESVYKVGYRFRSSVT